MSFKGFAGTLHLCLHLACEGLNSPVSASARPSTTRLQLERTCSPSTHQTHKRWLRGPEGKLLHVPYAREFANLTSLAAYYHDTFVHERPPSFLPGSLSR